MISEVEQKERKTSKIALIGSGKIIKRIKLINI
jgi:hypothetical protein